MSDANLLPDKYKRGGHSAKTLYIIRHGETDLNKRGIVRRARIFYLRNISGKKARIEEKKS